MKNGVSINIFMLTKFDFLTPGKSGNPDRDLSENIRFCSAMSTKSEIGAKVGQMPLVTSSAA